MNSKFQTSSSKSAGLTDDEVAVQNVLNKHLDVQVENLDFNISSKLSAARHKALAGQSRVHEKRFGSVGVHWLDLVSVSCAVALVLFVTLEVNTSAPETDGSQIALSEPTHFIEDLNILSATDDIDFYQSVEFLEWMESNAG